MRNMSSTDYETYREIMGELMRPIESMGLDLDTLKRLYQSKLVYLENLRAKCFIEINCGRTTHFTMQDYQLILGALGETNRHVRELILLALTTQLQKKSAQA
jgi:hypothetical protein